MVRELVRGKQEGQWPSPSYEGVLGCVAEGVHIAAAFLYHVFEMQIRKNNSAGVSAVNCQLPKEKHAHVTGGSLLLP